MDEEEGYGVGEGERGEEERPSVAGYMQWVSRTVCTCVCSPSVEPEAYLRGDACRDGVGERSGIPLVGAPSCGHLAGRHGVQEEVTRHIRTQLHHLGVMLRRLLLLRRHRDGERRQVG